MREKILLKWQLQKRNLFDIQRVNENKLYVRNYNLRRPNIIKNGRLFICSKLECFRLARQSLFRLARMFFPRRE